MEICREDVRVIEPYGNLDFEEKPVGAEGNGHFGAEHLDGHGPVVLEIGGEVHHSHPAVPDFPLDAVSCLQRLDEAGKLNAHG